MRVFLLACVVALGSSAAFAGEREQAKRMHDRLAGVPPSSTVLDDMMADIAAGRPSDAALTAMENPAFYNVTLKNWVTPWTNEEQTVFAPLNDYTATVIGLIRDRRDFRRVLYADVIYSGNATTINSDYGVSIPAYSMDNNAHYEAIENAGVDLSDGSYLVEQPQSAVTGLPSAATAGVVTTRQGARAFFYAGTNRAMFRFTFMNHMCNDLEQLQDPTRAPDRVRQDVSRSPGGDSRLFLNNCVACHAGMDAMAGAYAYYEWQYDMAADPEGADGRLIYTPGSVTAKHLINSSNFEPGYVTVDDSWINYWRNGSNAWLGWDAGLPGSGSGAKSLGEELANSTAFAQCQVKKAYRAVCLREPTETEVQNITTVFTLNNYDMQFVFAESAVACMGD